MIPYLTTIVVDAIVGFIALSTRNNSAALSLALFVFSLGLWQTELFLLNFIKDEDTLKTWFHLMRIGMFMAPCFLGLLTWHVCKEPKNFYQWILMPSFALMIGISFLNNTFLPSDLIFNGDGYLPKPDAVYSVFVVTTLYVFVGSITLGWSSYRTTTIREKRRIKWLLISLVLILVLGLLAVFTFVSFGQVNLSIMINTFANAGFVGVLLYAVINHHLADIGSALSALLTRIIVLGALASIFFAGLEFVDVNDSSMVGLLFKVIIFIVSVEFYHKLLSFVYPSARKLLVSGGYDYYSTTSDIRNAFNRSVELSDLVSVLDYLMLKVICVSDYQLCILENNGNTHNLCNIKDHSTMAPISKEAISQLELCKSYLIMQDEAEPSLQKMMEKSKAIACIGLIDNEKLIGVMFIHSSLAYKSDYFRYDDIRIFEWLQVQLPSELMRVMVHYAVLEDLGKAQKTASMIELMNQYHHDIKAPLSIIDGVVTNNLYDRDKQRKVILEQVARGSELITMMSNVLRGKRQRQVSYVNLVSIIKESIVLFEKDIAEVAYDIDEVDEVVGDANDLKILFINLIKNAVEAKIDDVPLKLAIEQGQESDSIWVSLADNGKGMSADQIEQLWKVSHSDKPMGSGVGLSAIKRIADEHGVFIDVESKLDHGSIFKLRFPIGIELS